MQSESERDEEEARSREAAYRRGFTHGMEEVVPLVCELLEAGFSMTTIKRLLAVHDDHFIHAWRHEGDLSKREGAPLFNLQKCQTILETTTGYDWIV